MGEQRPIQATPEPIGQSINTQTPSINKPPDPKKKSKTRLMVVLMVLLLAALGVAGYFVYQNKQAKKETVKEIEPSVSLTSPSPQIVQSSPSTDPTADWEIYFNNEYNYSIRFPLGFKTQLLASDVGTKDAPSKARALYIYNPADEEPYIKRYISLEALGLEPTYGNEWTRSQVSLAGKNVTKLVNPSQTNNFDIYMVQLDNGQGILEIYVSNTQDKRSISNQILATFKFIDQADETADWKTYIDDTYSFKYPSTWVVQPGTEQEESYWSGDFVKIISPVPTVSISISPKVSPYGFAGPVEQEEGETLNITVNGTIYQGIEKIRVEVGKTKVFVDIEIPINNKEFHILFGTGYPVNQDENASYSDYLKYRDTIVQLLSTLEIKS